MENKYGEGTHRVMANAHGHGRPYRYCPRCGGSLTTRLVKAGDPERLVCESCQEVLYLDPKVAVGTIIRDRDGRIVLVRRAIEPGYGCWVFPGGYVDRGEPLEAAASREALEECGLDVRLDGLVDVYSYQGRTPVIVVYAATRTGGELRHDDESLEARWFDRADIPWTSLAFPSTEQALRAFLRGRVHPMDGDGNRGAPLPWPAAAEIEVARASLDAILAMREDYRGEMRCQIVHDSWHVRGFTEPYLLRLGEETVGYGAVGGPPGEPRDVVKEFFVRPERRGAALALFRSLVRVSGARAVEAQTNDRLLSLMLHDCATDVTTDTILFEDAMTTAHRAPGSILRRVRADERARIFAHSVVPVGEWGLEHDGELVATGGILFHYNPPYGDLHMEVAAPYRRRGFGAYLVQELKRICYEMGRIPAARCNRDNEASRAALQRAGMFPCGRILRGRLAQ